MKEHIDSLRCLRNNSSHFLTRGRSSHPPRVGGRGRGYFRGQSRYQPFPPKSEYLVQNQGIQMMALEVAQKSLPGHNPDSEHPTQYKPPNSSETPFWRKRFKACLSRENNLGTATICLQSFSSGKEGDQ